MYKSYRLAAVLLAMLMVVAGASVALAQPPSTSHTRGSGPVSFDVPPGVCTAYPTGLKGSRESRVVSNVRTNPDGSTVTTTNAFAKGSGRAVQRDV